MKIIFVLSSLMLSIILRLNIISFISKIITYSRKLIWKESNNIIINVNIMFWWRNKSRFQTFFLLSLLYFLKPWQNSKHRELYVFSIWIFLCIHLVSFWVIIYWIDKQDVDGVIKDKRWWRNTEKKRSCLLSIKHYFDSNFAWKRI